TAQRLQFRSRQTTDPPILQEDGASSSVELDGGLVPVENRPLHPVTASLDRQASQMSEQGASESVPTPLRVDEQVLQVEARGPAKGRETVKEKREADLFRPHGADDHLGKR